MTDDKAAGRGKRLLGLDNQTVFGLGPVEHVTLAADLGCSTISIGPAPVPWRLDRLPDWSLRDDASLRREAMAALRDRGVSIALAEGFAIRPTTDARDRAADLDLMAGLGAARAGTVSMEPDEARALDQLATLADMAAARDMKLMFEYAPPHTFNTLDRALGALRAIDRPNVRLLIDSMHFFRTGGTVAALAALDPATVDYIQLSDAPRRSPGGDYYDEACFERLRPGEGELPLADLLRALPADVPIGLEVPMQAELTAADMNAPIGRIVAAARDLLKTL